MWEPLLHCIMIRGGGLGGRGSQLALPKITIEKNPTMVENPGGQKTLPPSF